MPSIYKHENRQTLHPNFGVETGSMLNPFPDPCVVTNAEIRSNDNVTYAYEPSSCWTLTSASCGPTPTFAVFSRKGSSGAKLDVVVMVGGHKVRRLVDVLI